MLLIELLAEMLRGAEIIPDRMTILLPDGYDLFTDHH